MSADHCQENKVFMLNPDNAIYFIYSDALNELVIKISGDLEKSSSRKIDLLPIRFQLAGKKYHQTFIQGPST